MSIRSSTSSAMGSASSANLDRNSSSLSNNEGNPSVMGTDAFPEQESSGGQHSANSGTGDSGSQFTQQTTTAALAKSPNTFDSLAKQPTAMDLLAGRTIDSKQDSHVEAEMWPTPDEGQNSGNNDLALSLGSPLGSLAPISRALSNTTGISGRMDKDASDVPAIIGDAAAGAQGGAEARAAISRAAGSVAAAGKWDVAGRLALAIQPAVGAYQGAQSASEDASPGEQFAGMIGGALKEADDVALSYGAGYIVGGLVASTGFGAAVAPTTGSIVGVGTSRFYDGSKGDGIWDNTVDDYIAPAIASTIDGTLNFIDQTKTTLGTWGD